VYVNEFPLDGVTLPAPEKGLPTLGIKVPEGDSPVSDSATYRDPLKTVPVIVTVQVEDAVPSTPV
jgi:hypothetical protein